MVPNHKCNHPCLSPLLDGRSRPCMHDMSISRFFAEIAMSSLNNASVTRPPDILTHLSSLPIKNRRDNRRPARCAPSNAPHGIALSFLNLILSKCAYRYVWGNLIRKDRGYHLIIMLHFLKRTQQFTASSSSSNRPEWCSMARQN